MKEKDALVYFTGGIGIIMFILDMILHKPELFISGWFFAVIQWYCIFNMKENLNGTM